MKGSGFVQLRCMEVYRGIVGIDLIRFEDRLTDVYEGYESICLLTAESKYVPSSHVTVLLTRFNDLLKLFCLTYGL